MGNRMADLLPSTYLCPQSDDLRVVANRVADPKSSKVLVNLSRSAFCYYLLPCMLSNIMEYRLAAGVYNPDTIRYVLLRNCIEHDPKIGNTNITPFFLNRITVSLE